MWVYPQAHLGDSYGNFIYRRVRAKTGSDRVTGNISFCLLVSQLLLQIVISSRLFCNLEHQPKGE
jgi:hypothetical protein